MAAAGVLRVVEREARVFRRMWHGSIFSGLVTPVLFLAAIGIGLGDLVDERRGDVAGLAYLDFVTPGLLAASAMQTAAGNSLWPVMVGTKWVGQFHGMVATPLRAGDVFAGFVVWNAVRTAMFSTAFLAVAVVLGGVGSGWAVTAVPGTALIGMAFGAPLAAFAATRDSDVSFAVIMRLGVMPLFLFSGTFFPVDVLPVGLQWLSFFSPLWHGVELCRGATVGSLGVWAALGHVSVLALVAGLGTWWGNRTFGQRLGQ